MIQSIQLTSHVGKDGILKIQMPPEIKDTNLEVLVVFQLLPTQEQEPTPSEWQPGFFEQVIGGWQGDALVRDSQGDYEVREQLF
jgi:hypothetical protein